MVCPPEILELVRKFRQNYAQYKSPDYNESQVRLEFIDPFFRALGWDVSNEAGFDEEFREVLVEEAVRVGESTRAPDYSFRIGGRRIFFVEAKKPSVFLKENPEPAFQVRRYGYSAQLKVSILTDFEEFSVYDCTVKPSIHDKASIRRIFYITYDQYEDRWDEIASIFEKIAVQQGGLRRLTDTLTAGSGRSGTQGLDKDFLTEIDGWRDLLAKNIALRNVDLSQRELNLAVQMTIDRILFLRICEDREIEPAHQLSGLGDGKDIYSHLVDLFRYADGKYNSGLFHFSQESGNDNPDTLTLSLKIDDAPLKEIIRHLYWPTPYVFSEIPADILGQVYEQFLGKVIRLTAGHQAKVELKPEVKKAGGVFYTPTYIVGYIVGETVGRLVENKSPKEVADLRIVDPACGSGSFLIGAYDFLLTWHRRWYMENLVPLLRAGKKPADPEVQDLLPVVVSERKGRGKRSSAEYPLPIYPVSDTDWHLTTTEKKRILLSSIHGVDIDAQAVEVTKLSLLLKVLEGESGERIGQKKLATDRVLPSLDLNIRCGNSLIGTDILVQSTLDGEAALEINPFDWPSQFPEAFAAGGFDAVIGNPPYVRQELLKGVKEYFSTHYATFQGTADLYVYFIEKGVSLLRENGQFSYIVANKWMRAAYGKPLRVWLKERQIEDIIDFGDLPVFAQATTYPCIIRMKRSPPDDQVRVTNVDTLDFPSLAEYIADHAFSLRQDGLDDAGWALVNEVERALLEKIRSVGIPLGEYVDGKIYYGIKTGLNKAFVIDGETKDRLIAEDPASAAVIKPFLAGKDVKRYQPLIVMKYLILFPKGWTNHQSGTVSNKWKWFQESYPAIAKHLEPFRVEAEQRDDQGDYWWELRACDYYSFFDQPKILYPDISVNNGFTVDEEGGLFSVNTTYFIPYYHPFLLGILNSSLIFYYYKLISAEIRGGYLRFFSQYIEKLPIRTIDSANPEDQKRHDTIVDYVTRMLDLNKKLATARLPQDKEALKRQIAATDQAIDTIVFDLYGLTGEERRIIEEAVR